MCKKVVKETAITCWSVLNDETIVCDDKISICVEFLDVILTDEDRRNALEFTQREIMRGVFIP
jgi:hypothetical protein